jgi:hypothetical protein
MGEVWNKSLSIENPLIFFKLTCRKINSGW